MFYFIQITHNNNNSNNIINKNITKEMTAYTQQQEHLKENTKNIILNRLCNKRRINYNHNQDLLLKNLHQFADVLILFNIVINRA